MNIAALLALAKATSELLTLITGTAATAHKEGRDPTDAEMAAVDTARSEAEAKFDEVFGD
jgi:hypothetical protein